MNGSTCGFSGFCIGSGRYSGLSRSSSENGLESKWRRYATDGFCLVFDTDKLGDLLREEFEVLVRCLKST